MVAFVGLTLEIRRTRYLGVAFLLTRRVKCTQAVLHVISDKQRHRLPLLEAMVQSALGGADVIQIREKKSPAQETYQFCEEFKSSCRDAGVVPNLFVNDRMDIAIATQAQGVHLAQKSLPVASAIQLSQRAQWDGFIGCSVHSLEEALAAYDAGVDYVTFGHVYASATHRGLPPRGVQELDRIVSALSIPVIAIGGIDQTNISSVLSTGCSGVAIIGAILDQDFPQAATAILKEQINRSTVTPKMPFIRRRRIDG